MPLIFMSNERDYRPFFSFDSASDADRNRWIDAFQYFLRKVHTATYCNRYLYQCVYIGLYV